MTRAFHIAGRKLPMKRVELTLITNKSLFARRAEFAGIDRIMIDLERFGKAKRQYGRQFFLSDHHPSDIDLIRAILVAASVQVRVNPWHQQSVSEINDVISRGAQIVMLPMVRDRQQAGRFVDAVNGRARTSLLIETAGALNDCERLLGADGVDEAHIGLNDLAIDLGREFIFEVLVDRRLDGVACIAAQRHLRFGFGAVAGRGFGPLPIDPELIISEQARLGASVAWLGRSYSRACEKLTRSELVNEMRWIRSKFERPGNTEVNFYTLQQQLGVWKTVEALAVAS
ncbi:MAG TPA: aldolase/citrate lyase family protein [Chthoniobacterales bacterium]|nr:aldolase/citrate lyase family protein [Chthoniobacterales bacterium]